MLPLCSGHTPLARLGPTGPNDHTPRSPAAAMAAARSGGTGRAAAAGEIRSVTSDVERAPATLDERTRPANPEPVPPPCPTPPRRREPSPTAPPTAARHTSAFYRPLLTLVTVARVRRAGPSVPPSSVAARRAADMAGAADASCGRVDLGGGQISYRMKRYRNKRYTNTCAMDRRGSMRGSRFAPPSCTQ